jgi:hypothetical protein
MSEVDSIFALFESCKCEAKYTIERHGAGYALYHGRCGHRHGYNLANMVEPAWNFDPKHIEMLINLGAAEYAKKFEKGDQKE